MKFRPNPEDKRNKNCHDTRNLKCFCGEVEDKHFREECSLSTVNELNNLSNSSASDDYIRVIKHTNAYGRIKFISDDPIKKRLTEYVRIADTDSLKDLMGLMKKHWFMLEPEKPSLCLSIIGGAKKFKMESKQKQIFLEGLINAAQTTNALIITSGLSVGIVKVVGDAFQNLHSRFFDRKSQQIKCLGVSPWGYVLNRELLTSRGSSQPIDYSFSAEVKEKQPVSLNANHTHYIFVDEGIRNRYGGSASAEFRAKLERQISADSKDGGWEIPVVLVVVEGGYDVLIDAQNSLEQKIPIVICSGTGRIADILHHAIDLQQRDEKTRKPSEFDQEQEADLKSMLISCLSLNESDAVDEAYQMLIKIIKQDDLLTIFDMNKSTRLDSAILYALIKTQSNVKSQLELCLAWDQIDVAKEKILKPVHQNFIPSADLESIMMRALIEDKTQFVKLLLEKGVVFCKFLTIERLHMLYNESDKPDKFITNFNYFRIKQKIHHSTGPRHKLPLPRTNSVAESDTNVVVYLESVRKLVKRMLGRFNHDIYEFDDEDLYNAEHSKALVALIQSQCFRFPFRELFIWAVLFHRQEMARFVWENSEDSIALALVGCKLYRSAMKAVPVYDTETYSLLEKYISEFENLAIKTLEKMNSSDPETTLYLIEFRCETWGNMNCLDLASSCQAKHFLSTIACQNSLNSTWCHGIQSGILASILAIVFPPLLLVDEIFAFKYVPELKKMPQTDQSVSMGNNLPHIGNLNLDPCYECKTNEFLFRAFWFYTAPRTKFFLHTIVFILFLFYFTWVLLFRLNNDSVNRHEIAIMCYLAAMCLEKCRQVCNAKAERLKNKVILWWNTSSWYRVDLFICIFALITIIVRSLEMPHFHGLCANLYAIISEFPFMPNSSLVIVLYMKIFRLYTVNKNLGPKLVMIQRMMKELLTFIFILLVVLVAYGSAKQALLFPNVDRFNWQAIGNIINAPYWVLYGEFDLDLSFARTCQGEENEFDGKSCPVYNLMFSVSLSEKFEATEEYRELALNLQQSVVKQLARDLRQEAEDSTEGMLKEIHKHQELLSESMKSMEMQINSRLKAESTKIEHLGRRMSFMELHLKNIATAIEKLAILTNTQDSFMSTPTAQDSPKSAPLQ
ncbi:hypothetical protein Ciccas_001705 [Cichlidogyrus casuarinus]|uniref:Uncharacterized protein n=1 Tax=Cichlidogyrus casuarinus TaxID=1844966 RepID=A0ABD2QJE5_9PLAT